MTNCPFRLSYEPTECDYGRCKRLVLPWNLPYNYYPTWRKGVRNFAPPVSIKAKPPANRPWCLNDDGFAKPEDLVWN